VTDAVGSQNADKNPARGESKTAAGPDTSAKPRTSQTADLKKSDEKRSSASATKKSNTTLSPQLIAPPATSSTPKAKVIQWP
ncbi:MAG: hypothetical protein M3Y84_08740, partial [Acidobacteriota bacterium]|nr:hypothetical protein [Acidobacteriota bacterium]